VCILVSVPLLRLPITLIFQFDFSDLSSTERSPFQNSSSSIPRSLRVPLELFIPDRAKHRSPVRSLVYKMALMYSGFKLPWNGLLSRLVPSPPSSLELQSKSQDQHHPRHLQARLKAQAFPPRREARAPSLSIGRQRLSRSAKISQNAPAKPPVLNQILDT
jgi:hypothetical protein